MFGSPKLDHRPRNQAPRDPWVPQKPKCNPPGHSTYPSGQGELPQVTNLVSGLQILRLSLRLGPALERTTDVADPRDVVYLLDCLHDAFPAEGRPLSGPRSTNRPKRRIWRGLHAGATYLKWRGGRRGRARLMTLDRTRYFRKRVAPPDQPPGANLCLSKHSLAQDAADFRVIARPFAVQPREDVRVQP